MPGITPCDTYELAPQGDAMSTLYIKTWRRSAFLDDPRLCQPSPMSWDKYHGFQLTVVGGSAEFFSQSPNDAGCGLFCDFLSSLFSCSREYFRQRNWAKPPGYTGPWESRLWPPQDQGGRQGAVGSEGAILPPITCAMRLGTGHL